MKPRAALLIVDVQVDFCPGGALAVPDGDRVAAPLGRLASVFAAAGLPVLASRDWHPPVTSHFAAYGGQWPPHCIQDTAGAAFHPDLILPEGVIVVSKGINPDRDAYSAFDGSGPDGRPLLDILTSCGVTELDVGGLATDYCVRATVLDAMSRGFRVTVLADCVAGVDLNQGDSARALEEMRCAGAHVLTSEAAAEEVGRDN